VAGGYLPLTEGGATARRLRWSVGDDLSTSLRLFSSRAKAAPVFICTPLSVRAFGRENAMRLLASFIVALLILVGAIVFWFWTSFPTVSYRYRLTVAVEVDGQVHSGSSVIALLFRFNPKWLPPSGGTYNVFVTGQAVLINLGPHGALIAALAGKPYDLSVVDASLLPSRAFLPALWNNPSDSTTTPKNQRSISQMKGPGDLDYGGMPAFYWFSNPADLASAKEVKPADFASVIGDATRLVSAQIEITHDPVVIDIDKNLPAYATLTAPPNKGIYITPSGLTVGSGMFIAGRK
jgi:hypothetical protein